MRPGALVLDSSCFKYLEDESIRARVHSSLRVADLELWPSALNVVELSKTSNAAVRERLLRIAKALSPGALLPTPQDLLRRLAEAALNREPGFITQPSGVEWLLDDPSDLTDEIITNAQALATQADQAMEQAHSSMREQLKHLDPTREIRQQWPTAADFLERQWMRPDQIDTFIQGVWKTVGLPGPAPIEVVLTIEGWRLYLEGQGVAIYRRAVAHEMGRTVQMSDLSQLTYLAGRHKRVLVTADRGFLAAARDVLHGRYPNARALGWSEFLDLAG